MEQTKSPQPFLEVRDQAKDDSQENLVFILATGTKRQAKQWL
jgi:hypothetical protein